MTTMAGLAALPASVRIPLPQKGEHFPLEKDIFRKQGAIVSSRSLPCRKRRALPAATSSSLGSRNDDSRSANDNSAPGHRSDELARASRRDVLRLPAVIGSVVLGAAMLAPDSAEADPSKFTDMPALRGKDYGKTAMRYPDYVLTDSGLQYKDLREGAGPCPEPGQQVVIDWAGFTIGYYGRIFEARNKAKGGSFEGNEKDFYRFRVGQGQVIPAFEEAIVGMKVGGIRRVVVPPDLGYPDNDFNKLGPRPMTFSGQRALDFVLKNQGLIDKTLLFDIELLRVYE